MFWTQRMVCILCWLFFRRTRNVVIRWAYAKWDLSINNHIQRVSKLLSHKKKFRNFFFVRCVCISSEVDAKRVAHCLTFYSVCMFSFNNIDMKMHALHSFSLSLTLCQSTKSTADFQMMHSNISFAWWSHKNYNSTETKKKRRTNTYTHTHIWKMRKFLRSNHRIRSFIAFEPEWEKAKMDRAPFTQYNSLAIFPFSLLIYALHTDKMRSPECIGNW